MASDDAGNPSNYEKLLTQMETDGIKDPKIEIILSQIRSLKQVAGNAL